MISMHLLCNFTLKKKKGKENIYEMRTEDCGGL